MGILPKLLSSTVILSRIYNKLNQFVQLSPDLEKNKSLWGISFVSFFGGTASVMVFSILSMFMREELHLSYKEVGLIEGVAIFVAFLAKIFSGLLSDRLSKRKSFILLGTIGSVLIKPLFALATGVMGVFAAKSLDRLVKGVRAAPTDALIADLSVKAHEGVSFGSRYTFYALGFMCGGGASSLLMHYTQNNFRVVFWASMVPAVLSLLMLYYCVEEPQTEVKVISKPKKIWHLKDIWLLPRSYWHLMGVTFLLMNARFSDSFLHYRGRELGFAIAAMPLFMMLYNFAEAIAPFPIGKLADKMNRYVLFLIGISVLILANAGLLFVHAKGVVVISMVLAGLHLGMTQGLIGTLIASSTLPHLKGTAFAIFYCVAGSANMLGNYMAGYLAEHSNLAGYGVLGAFGWGFGATCLAAVYLLSLIRAERTA